MRFTPVPLAGAFVVDIESNEDERGMFARTWCTQEFAAHGLDNRLVQVSLSRNRRRGTVRGMHLQLPPSREAKLVRCVRGSILDVIVDMRPDSSTFGQHFEVELTAQNARALYIPSLMAHGFQTLEDDSDVAYQMSDYHAPVLSFGLRWDDPALGIVWPIRDSVIINARDRDCPDFDPIAYRRMLQVASTP